MLNFVDKLLINQFQRHLPLSPTPYADMAAELGLSETEVLCSLQHLQDQGIVSRVGPVFNHCSAGASTLAAIKVPSHQLAQVAQQISSYPEVNHNYEREHDYNLWFVVTAPHQERLQQVLDAISDDTGYCVLNLPMEKSYHIDLAFPIEWKDDTCN